MYGIVTTAKGHIPVSDTDPGRGTTFRVDLPVAKDESDRDSANKPGTGAQLLTTSRADPGSSRPGPSVANGTARSAPLVRVLLVEDVPEVRSLASQILQDAEFSVTEAVDADDAMGKLRAMTHPPDVLVTDMQMPGMNGHDLASRVRADHPGVRVLFVSGYAPETSMRAGAEGHREAFLPKPFSPDELTRAVRGLVQRQGTGDRRQEAVKQKTDSRLPGCLSSVTCSLLPRDCPHGDSRDAQAIYIRPPRPPAVGHDIGH